MCIIKETVTMLTTSDVFKLKNKYLYQSNVIVAHECYLPECYKTFLFNDILSPPLSRSLHELKKGILRLMFVKKLKSKERMRLMVSDDDSDVEDEKLDLAVFDKEDDQRYNLMIYYYF